MTHGYRVTNFEEHFHFQPITARHFCRGEKKKDFEMKKCDCLHKRTGTEQTLDELDWERNQRLEMLIFESLPNF